MKYILTVICLWILMSCQPSTTVEQSSEVASVEDTLDISTLKAYFTTQTLTKNPLNIHHWVWSDEENDAFRGAAIASTLLTKYIDPEFFQIRDEEEYFAVAYFEPIDAYLLRTRMDDVDYMQQLFLLVYDAEKQAFVSWTRVAAFLGAEGFINQMASWLTTDKLIQRNRNWSSNPNTGETETDSIRTHIFENHTFTVKETIPTDELLEEKYPLK